MPKDLLIGVDIGTTSAKSMLFDGQGNALAQAAQEYPTNYPQPGWAEQDPVLWWQAVCHTLRRLFADNAYAPTDIAAVGVSAQAPTLVPVDSRGNLLHPALIWMDRRSDPQCDWLRDHVGQTAIAAINGGRIDPFFLAPKLLWYRDRRPESFRATSSVLQANGFIVQRLTGRLTMDSSHCPLTLFFDSQNQEWSEDLLQQMDLDISLLPPVANCAEIVGEVTAAAAAETNLAPGTLVIAGMVDGTAAAMEAGAIHRGDAVEMTGQSTVLLICNDHPYLEDDLFPLGHAMPDRHLVVGAQVASGGSLRWFRDQLGEPERSEAERRGLDPFDLLAAQAAASQPGANRLVFLPYMYGERSPIWNSHARGAFIGLSLSTTKADLVRAIMEGAAYGLRHNVDAAASASFVVEKLVCVGGGARSPLWNQIKADILQRPIHVPRTATGAPLGNAIAAAAAAGIHPDVASATQAMTEPGHIVEPNAALAAQYDALYSVYLDLYPSLRNAFSHLAIVPDP